nr:hypothetical protein [Tanacetum cinerariifolium]
MELETTQTSITAKLPMLKQAQTTTDDVGTSTTLIPGPITTKEKAQKNNDVKARSMLLMTLPNEHLMTFNKYKDAKSLFATIETRFGGNEARKRTQKTLLKQMNKSDLDTMSIDDFYNNFKIVKQEVKGTTSLNLSSQNMDFMSFPSTSSANEVNTAYGKTSKKITINGNDTAGYDKFKVECFNCYKMGHFAREYRQLRNQDSRNWNQDSSRRTVNVEETPPKAMVAIDGVGLFSPPKLDLSNSGLEEFQQHEFEGYGPKNSKNVSDDIPIKVKESLAALLVKDRVLESKDSLVESHLVVEKKPVVPTVAKIEFVKAKQQEKPVGKLVKKTVITIKGYHQRERVVSKNNYTRVNYNNSTKKTHPNAHRNMAPRAVLMKTGLRPVNTVRPVNTAYPKTTVHSARPISCFSKLAQSTIKRRYQQRTTLTNQSFSQKVNTAKGRFNTARPRVVNTDRPRPVNAARLRLVNTARPNSAVVNAVRVNPVNAVKASACWVWRPTKPNGASITLRRHSYIDVRGRSKNLIEDMLPLVEELKEEELLVKELLKLNRVLVVKPRNRTLYELFRGRSSALSFIRPFRCHVTILNTLDHLGKFNGKFINGLFVGYSLNSKAFRVYNLRTIKVEENLHIRFLEDKHSIAGNGPKWLFDIDVQIESMNYVPVVAGTNSNDFVGTKESIGEGHSSKEKGSSQDYILMPLWKDGLLFDSSKRNACNDELQPSSDAGHKDDKDLSNISTTYQVLTTPNTRIYKDHSLDHVIGDVQSGVLTRSKLKPTNEQGFISAGKKAIGTKWIFRNKKDERGIVIKNKARLVTHGYTQEKDIDYDEVFAPVVRIKAIRMFLAYASFIAFMVYQMDVKSAFLYGMIEEEIYVCQPLRFEDPGHPDKVYKVVKSLYGLHQGPRAWYKTLAKYLLGKGFHRGKIEQTLYIKRQQGDILLVQVYVDDIIFGSTKKELCNEFERLMKDKFHMNVKSTNTLVNMEKALVKDADGDDVDVHLYKSMIGSLMYLTTSRPDIIVSLFELVAYTDSDYAGASLDMKSTTGGCQFLRSRLISWQCKNTAVINIERIDEHTKTDRVKCEPKELRELVKIFNGEAQIQALVDKKKVIITETSARSDLHLEDDEGMLKHKDIYVTPSYTKKIYANMKRQGKDFSDEHVTNTSNDLLSETKKANQALEIGSLKRRVKRLEKKASKKTHKLKRLYKIDLDADEGVALVDETQGRNDQDMFDTSIFDEDEMVAKKDVSTVGLVTIVGEEVTTAGVEVGNRFHRGKIDQTLFIKRQQGDILLMQVYVDDIIFGSTKKELCTKFERLMKDKFQMSSMGELTFFLGLQVKQKEDGIFITQDKYVTEVLRKFNFSNVKSTNTPLDMEKTLVKDADGEYVDVHLYKSMIGSLIYLTTSRPDIIDSLFELVAYTDSDYAGASLDRKSTTGGCQFLGSRLISWQCNNKKLMLLGKLTTAIDVNAVQVAFMEKRTESEGFEQIINCLKANPIKYALTVNPTIYTSCIKQFWATTKVKMVNGEAQIQALVDMKKVIITETSVRSDLHLEDAEAIECLPIAIIFEQLTLMGVLALETTKANQALEIGSLKRRVKKLEKKASKKTQKLKRLYKIGVALVDETQRRNDQDMFNTSIFNKEEVVAKKDVSTADLITNVGEEVTTTGVEVSTAAITSQISMDEITLAKALIDIKTSKPKAKGIVKKDPSKAPIPTQIDSSQQSSKAKDKEKAKIIKPEKPLKRNELVKGSKNATEGSKKAVKGSEKVQEELKRCLEIILKDDDDVTIEATPLPSKSPTVINYNIYKEERKSFFKIIRADGIVKVLNWKHFDSCGVYCVTTQNMVYYILVEKMYPFTRNILQWMWNDVRLQVDYEVEMAYDLLRLIRRQINEGYVSE